ncbi:MAG: DsbA family oxidoreductase [Micavibrio sp.]|nr:DsbA family oxidoreductase [Micavibrio sp.]
MRLEVWSDIACPWCYIGKEKLDKALAQFEGRDDVEVIWRSYLLDPDAPASYGLTMPQLLAKKYDMTPEEAKAATAKSTAAAREVGLTYNMDIAQPGNTYDGHRLVHYANTEGKGEAMKTRLWQAYFTKGESVGDRETLVRLAKEVGLNEDAVRKVLTSDQFGQQVKAEDAEAEKVGVDLVPFFLIDGKHSISGVVSTDALLDTLRNPANARPQPKTASKPGCDENGCAI